MSDSINYPETHKVSIPEGKPHRGITIGNAAGAVLGLGAVGGVIGFFVEKNNWEKSVQQVGNTQHAINTLLRFVPKPVKRYVPDGVFLVCDKGITNSTLKVTSQHSVRMAGGRLMATINDRMESNFWCTAMVVAGALIAVIAAAIAVAIIAAVTAATFGVGAIVLIALGATAGGAVLGFLGTLLCTCAFLTSGSTWIPVHSFTRVEKQYALIETSEIPCFLGGQIKIMYTEAAANKMSSICRNETAKDLGTTFFAGIFLVGGAAAVGGTYYGGSVAYSAGGWKGLGSFAAGSGAGLGGAYLFGTGFDWGKREAYNALPSWEDGYSLQDLKDGKNVRGIFNESGSDLPEQYNQDSSTEDLKDTEEKISKGTGLDPGIGEIKNPNAEGRYVGRGVWNDPNFGVVNPSAASHAKLIGRQLYQGATSPFMTKDGGIMTGIGVVYDFYQMWRNSSLGDELKELLTILEEEEVPARMGIKVVEDDIN
jgi:hypothetical protein